MRVITRTRGKPAKRTVYLPADADIPQSARKAGLNLSAVLERALAEETAQRWLENNRCAIEANNEDVRANGV